MGETWAMRRAGAEDPSSVVTTPTEKDTTKCQALKAPRDSGKFTVRPESRFAAVAPATPKAMPNSAETTPTTRASRRTRERIWERVAPIARSKASSRLRCANKTWKVIETTMMATKVESTGKINSRAVMIPAPPVKPSSCLETYSACGITLMGRPSCFALW